MKYSSDIQNITGAIEIESEIACPVNDSPFGCRILLEDETEFDEILKQREQFKQLVARVGVIVINFSVEADLNLKIRSTPAAESPHYSLPWHIDKDYKKPRQSSIIYERKDLWQQKPAIMFNINGSTRNASTAFSKPKTLADAVNQLFELPTQKAIEYLVIDEHEIENFKLFKKIFHQRYSNLQNCKDEEYSIKLALILRDICVTYPNMEKVSSKIVEYLHAKIKNQILTVRWDTQAASLGQIVAFKQYDPNQPKDSIIHTRINKPDQKINSTLYHGYL